LARLVCERDLLGGTATFALQRTTRALLDRSNVILSLVIDGGGSINCIVRLNDSIFGSLSLKLIVGIDLVIKRIQILNAGHCNLNVSKLLGA
jgi:hypothetical protein